MSIATSVAPGVPALDMRSVEPAAGEFSGPMAWRSATVSESDWLVEVPPACIDELDDALAMLEAERMPMLALECTSCPSTT